MRKKKIQDLLRRYADVFAKDEFDLGYPEEIKHSVELTEEAPIRQPYRRILPPRMAEVQEHLKCLLKQGIIRPSCPSCVVLIRLSLILT